MKKQIILTLCLLATISANAQTSKLNPASEPTGLTVDFSLYGGYMNVKPPTQSAILDPYNFISPRYAGSANASIQSTLMYGAMLEVGYTLKGNLGIGTGLFFTYQQSTINLDDFNVSFANTENVNYQSGNGNIKGHRNDTFKQMINANSKITENASMFVFTVPLLLKYKFNISPSVELNMDGGVLLNFYAISTSSMSGYLDYTAIYYYHDSGNKYVVGSPSSTNQALVLTDSTRNSFYNLRTKYQYNVGLHQQLGSGNPVKYGLSPAIFFRVQGVYHYSPNIALLLGISFARQTLKPTDQSPQPFTNKIGQNYNSLLNYTGNQQNIAFGINIGVRYNFTNNRKSNRDVGKDALKGGNKQ